MGDRWQLEEKGQKEVDGGESVTFEYAPLRYSSGEKVNTQRTDFSAARWGREAEGLGFTHERKAVSLRVGEVILSLRDLIGWSYDVLTTDHVPLLSILDYGGSVAFRW